MRSFEQRYPNTSPALLKVLESLLEFNPFFRPSATEILRSPVFDKIRNGKLESVLGNSAPFRIENSDEFDQFFDHEKNEIHGISEDDLKIKLI